MRIKRWIVLGGLALATWGPAAMAQTTLMAGKCALRSSTSAVVILVCANNAKPEMWRDAGIAACKDRENCNAWIWDDAAKAPLKATDKDEDLPKSATREAVAIWVSESKSLMTLQKTPAQK